MASLAHLPPELILEISNWLLLDGDPYPLASFSAANRSLHGLVSSVLYTEYGADAFQWAAQHGRIATLEKAIRHVDDEMDLINPDSYLFTLKNNFALEYEADPLHVAAKYGQDEVVTWLLDRGANITAPSIGLCDCYYFDHIWEDQEDPTAWHPLHLAICHKHTSTALLLLSRGAPLHVNHSEGGDFITALQSASRSGLEKVVRYIKDHYVKRTRHSASKGKAVEGQKPLGTGFTSSNGSSTPQYLYPSNPANISAYCGILNPRSTEDESWTIGSLPSETESDASADFASGETGQSESWPYSREVLLYEDAQSVDPNPAFVDINGRTALHYVAYCPDYDAACAIISDLVELGHDIEDTDETELAPLHLACAIGNFASARALLNAGADANVILEDDDTPGILESTLYSTYSNAEVEPLFESKDAWTRARMGFLKELLKKQLDVEDHVGDETPLMIAARLGLVDEARLLIGIGGADVNFEGEGGSGTPLDRAIVYGRVAIAELLIAAGANINRRDAYGETPLSLACLNSAGEVCVPLLLRHGARVDKSHCTHHDLLLRQVKLASCGERNALEVLLENSTRANIDEASWQAACMASLIILDPHLHVCEMLGRFGIAANYTFQDDDIPPLVAQVIELGDASAVDKLFALGDGEVLRTKTGVFTKAALLVMALMRRSPWVDKGLMTRLVAETGSIGGRVRCLRGQPTLLHLAASSRTPNIPVIKYLLAGGLEVDTPDMFAITPLGKAVFAGNLEVVNTLLAAGADPLLRAPCIDWEPIGLGPHGPAVDDLLRPPEGSSLSRGVLEFLTESSVSQHFQQDTSALGFAVRLGRSRILHAFLTKDIVIPRTPPTQTRSYILEACGNRNYGVAHQLLRAGARPKNAMEGVHILALLITSLKVIKWHASDHEARAGWADKTLAIIQHMLDTGADAYLSDGPARTAVELLEFYLTNNISHIPAATFKWFSIGVDRQGRKILKSRQRILDTWLLK